MPLIRTARAADIDPLVAIEQAVFATDRLSRRSFRRHVASLTAALRVVETNGEIGGYFLLLFRAGSERARLYSLAAAPAAVGQGLGRLLLGEAERLARERGCDALVLEVRPDNEQALRLYERAGYRRERIVEDYYKDGAPALRLVKRLTP